MSKPIQFKNEKGKLHLPSGNRRSFLKFGGATLAATTLLLAGCQDVFSEDPQMGNPNLGDSQDSVNLGKGDIGILNYAYTLEQLEAAFYLLVVATPYAGMSAAEAVIMEDLKNHEVAHRDFLKAALGNDAIIELTFDFSAVDFNSRDSVLATAKVFEDLGVAAYNGAGQLLESADLLLIAGKIVSVEARHAAAIRSIFDDDFGSFAGSDVIDTNGLDRALAPNVVLEAASPFIINTIIADQLPKP